MIYPRGDYVNISDKQYGQMVKQASPPSNVIRDCFFAFVTGGLICVLGQILTNLFLSLNLPKTDASTLTSVSLIFLGSLLTGLNIYDNIAVYGGAGTLVPITGFANAVVSPAIEFKSEGWVLGLGAKIFTIAGPVISYGTVASVIYVVIYLVMMFFKCWP